MKSHLNPQPYAVERSNNPKTPPSNLEGSKKKNIEKHSGDKSNKEIFKQKSEEQAWREVLQKNKLD